MGSNKNLGIGLKIRAKREELNITQAELGKRIGVSRNAIWKVENGDDNMTPERVEKFARALNTTPAYLVGWKIEENEEIEYTDEEKNMIISYRKSDPDTQAMIRRLLAYAERMK